MGGQLSKVVALGLPLVAGQIVGIATTRQVFTWYDDIKKPRWTPPKWVFGPTWGVLYALQGYASWLVWNAGGGAVPLGLYGVQLAMNLAWTPTFFNFHKLGAASIDVTALLGVIGATMVSFHKVDPLAAKLMVPYLGFSAFAAALTVNVWMSNSENGKDFKRRLTGKVEEGKKEAKHLKREAKQELRKKE